MISNAWATIRTVRSFLPLLRPFIIKLKGKIMRHFRAVYSEHLPVNQTFDDRHLGLLELLLGISAGSVRQVNSMANLDVISKRDILYFNTASENRLR